MKTHVSYNSILCRYGEIALKKQNRKRFEMQLVNNIRHALRAFPDFRVRRVFGRMFINRPDFAAIDPKDVAGIGDALRRVFGLASVSFGIQIESDLSAIEEAVCTRVATLMADHPEGETTYRMRARRSFKQFPMRSKEMEIHFAEKLLTAHPQLKIDLSDSAELTVYLEVRDKWSFVSFDSIDCPGGLPCGSSASTMALLSGGIDSPVACHMIMGRGCQVNYLTFHSYPYTTPDLLEKVAQLASILNRWQYPGRLFACNMSEVQKLIRDNCASRFRTILYRRVMFRVAERLAKAVGDDALVTGESLGQVASQTIPNMDTINASTDMLILRPLLGIDKLATIARAREIGTYDVSNIPCADSCTVFMPDNPATNSRRHLLDNEETRFDMDAALELTLAAITEVEIPDGDEKPLDFEL